MGETDQLMMATENKCFLWLELGGKRSSAFLFPPNPAGHGEQFSVLMAPFHGNLPLTDVITVDFASAGCKVFHGTQRERKKKCIFEYQRRP